MSLNGYMENINLKKTLYTEEQIKKFESDVKNGEYLDLKDYTSANDIDYSNKASDFGADLSELIATTAKKSIGMLSNIFAYLLERLYDQTWVYEPSQRPHPNPTRKGVLARGAVHNPALHL